MMNLFVESLKNLYKDNRVDIEEIERLLSERKIDEKEKQYILRKEE